MVSSAFMEMLMSPNSVCCMMKPRSRRLGKGMLKSCRPSAAAATPPSINKIFCHTASPFSSWESSVPPKDRLMLNSDRKLTKNKSTPAAKIKRPLRATSTRFQNLFLMEKTSSPILMGSDS